MLRALCFIVVFHLIVGSVTGSRKYFPDDICNKFKPGMSSVFNEECAKAIGARKAARMYTQCIFLLENKPWALQAYFNAANKLCAKRGHPLCRNIVFILDSSSDIGSDKFSKFKDFVEDVLEALQLESTTLKAFIQQFSDNPSDVIEIENAGVLDLVQFIGGVTNTHSVIQELNTFYTEQVDKFCLATGVFLLSGRDTDRSATLDALLSLNTDQEKGFSKERARTIAVGIDMENSEADSSDFKAMLKSIASGFRCDNVELLEQFSDLADVGTVDNVRGKIAASPGVLQDTCAQFLAVNSIIPKLGYYGVYEQMLDGRTCSYDGGNNIKKVYEHVNDKTWILTCIDGDTVAAAFSGTILWTIQAHNTAKECELNFMKTVAVNIMSASNDDDKRTPDQFPSPYVEIRHSPFGMQMLAKCFSYQVLADDADSC